MVVIIVFLIIVFFIRFHKGTLDLTPYSWKSTKRESLIEVDVVIKTENFS